EVGPAGGQALEHRCDEDALGALGQHADVRVSGRLVAGDDQQADLLRSLALAVVAASPGVGDAASVRGARQVERARAGLAREAELARQRGHVRATRTLLARPDQDRPLARAQPPAKLVVLPGQAAAALVRVAG